MAEGCNRTRISERVPGDLNFKKRHHPAGKPAGNVLPSRWNFSVRWPIKSGRSALRDQTMKEFAVDTANLIATLDDRLGIRLAQQGGELMHFGGSG